MNITYSSTNTDSYFTLDTVFSNSIDAYSTVDVHSASDSIIV